MLVGSSRDEPLLARVQSAVVVHSTVASDASNFWQLQLWFAVVALESAHLTIDIVQWL